MDANAIVIDRLDMFKASYGAKSAHVAPRGFSSLTFRLSGEISIFAADLKLFSGPGSLTFVPAGYEYETQVHTEGEMLILHYGLANGSRDLCSRPMTVVPEHADAFINLFTRGVRRFQGERGSLDCTADAYRLLSEANRAFFGQERIPYKRLAECKRYIDANFCDPALKISSVVEQFGASEVYFRREFKKYYGLSPITYLKKQRLETACRFLRLGIYSVAEVATLSGFDSISYFSSEFRRSFGCSPREYKKN